MAKKDGALSALTGHESGANAFVRKPNNLQEFFAKIQTIMSFWVGVAEFFFNRELQNNVGDGYPSRASQQTRLPNT